MVEKSQQLSCVLIPVRDRTLLLPNVTIAEIVDYDLETRSSDTNWLLGWIQWRGVSLPVISFEATDGNQAAEPDGRRGRILVINTLTELHQSMPFMAMATQGIPRQAKVAPDELRKQDESPGAASLMTVRYEGEECIIPDLSVMESLAARSTA